MGKLILVTGGARSGKSEFAEQEVMKQNSKTVYIATAVAFDEGMKDRIRQHRERRPKEWATIECYKNFESMQQNPDFVNADVLLFDCLTVMITNNMMDFNLDYDTCSMEDIAKVEAAVGKEVETLLEVCKDKTLYVVTNEIGLGLAPAYKLGGYFRDIAGRMNQMVASRADEVYFTVSGIPMKIK